MSESNTLKSNILGTGQKAPNFSSFNQNNGLVSLAAFKGSKNVVLYFYPKDDTPGCTIEAKQFTALVADFSTTDTVVIGVSKDNCDSHQAFIEKFGLKIDLLADTSGEVCEAYGVWQEKEKKGVKKMGVVRSTFIIDKQGVIHYAEYGVSAEGHALAILKKVKEL